MTHHTATNTPKKAAFYFTIYWCIGDKWTLMVVDVLHNDPLRFNETRRVIQD